MFAFGFFPFYEYAIISRFYVLGILFIIALCAALGNPKRNYLFLATLLFLLTQTHLFGVILAVTLCAALIFEGIIDKDASAEARRHKSAIVTGFVIVIAGVILALIQIVPPLDTSFPEKLVWYTGFNLQRIGTVLFSLWIAYFPVLIAWHV